MEPASPPEEKLQVKEEKEEVPCILDQDISHAPTNHKEFMEQFQDSLAELIVVSWEQNAMLWN